MKYFFLLFSIVYLLSSCSLVKKTVNKVFKKSDSVATVKTDTKTNLQETVKTTLTEKADTTIRQPADTSKGSERLDDLVKGIDIKETNGRTEVIVHYDPGTKKVTGTAISKKRDFHFLINKVLTTEKTSTQKTESRQADKTELKKKESDKTVTTTRQNTAWIWIIVGILVLLALAWLAWKIFKPRLL